MLSASLKLKINPLLEHRGIHSSRNSPASTVKCSLRNSQEYLIDKIRERVDGKVEITPSAYDTAWVAMVPDGAKPRFPECLDWIVENQNPDGSWGVQSPSPSLLKHSLSCTLACLLPLRKWNLANQLLHKGLEFLRSNAAATNKDELTPIGFDVIFPMTIQYANDLNLDLPLSQDFVDTMFQNRNAEIKRNQNLGFVAEGLGNSIDWNKILMMHQRKNGSLFNSPATTAAALIHCHDGKCLEYLNSLLCKFKTWVPSIYPMDVCTRLRLVDHLQGLGVDRFIQLEIDTILQETFRLWQQEDEEIFSDVTCRAMAFRLLRLKGYHVTPDGLAPYVDQDSFFATVSLESSGTDTILELFKASQVRLPEDDDSLEKVTAWTFKMLKHHLASKSILDKKLEKKVEFNLKNHRGILDAVKYRRNFDLYDIDHFQTLKSAPIV